jgi:polysaccharide deacetylase 2 family uncharacterized protein YibQ
VRKRSPAVRRTQFAILLCVLSGLTFAFVSCDKRKSRDSSRNSAPLSARQTSNPSPRLAIIIDDVGSDSTAVDAIFALPYPLTLSVLPGHPRSTVIAEEAHQRGFQVMLHLPMESQANETPEGQELRVGMTTSQVSQLLGEMLLSVPHAVGVNNHQGSLATSDPRLMSELMPLLRARNLFFIDSRTIATTVAYDNAERDGVRSGFRNVPFLDDLQQESAIRHQLHIAVQGAKAKGEAIAIAHPHPETLRVLRDVLPQLQSEGVELVHVSTLVR